MAHHSVAVKNSLTVISPAIVVTPGTVIYTETVMTLEIDTSPETDTTPEIDMTPRKITQGTTMTPGAVVVWTFIYFATSLIWLVISGLLLLGWFHRKHAQFLLPYFSKINYTIYVY
jgi:hypothetical protein